MSIAQLIRSFSASQVNPYLTPSKVLNNPNADGTSDNDYFGSSVAVDGNRVVVGAYAEDDAAGETSGKVYIFDATTGSLLHTLHNPNAYGTSANDYFGYSVAISGNLAIISARYEDEDEYTGRDSGKAYIFDVTTGSLLHTLHNPNADRASAFDSFGYSVAISGNYAIISARNEDAAGETPGKVYIFDATTGSLLHTLHNPNADGTSDNDFFGYSVAISGNLAIISARYEDEDGYTGRDSGKAYIFDVTTGSLLRTLDNPNAYGTSANDYFGSSVAISGNLAIISARNEDEATGRDSGKAYIFDVTTGSLLHTLHNPNADRASAFDSFGYSVAISGNYAIISARNEDAAGETPGKVYIFDATTGSLLHTLHNPNADGTSDNDFFGSSVAISGNLAIIGSHFEDDAPDNNSGKAYIFDATTGSLLHTLHNPNAYSTSADDYFGTSVAISGNRVVVGASDEDDAGGTDSGRVYLYNLN